MAAGTLRELLVLIGVDGEDAEKNLAAVEDSIGNVKAAMTDLVEIAVAVTAALAAVAGAAIYQAVATGEYAEQVLEQAAALGVTTDAYQELVFIASKYGIESEKITLILSKLAADQVAIADGNEDTAATYAALGLSMEEVAKASPAELLAELADGFAAVTSDTERLALASAIFGDRMASKVIPLLQGGAVGMEEMARQAHDLGVILDRDAIATANDFNDQVETLGLLLTSVRNAIGLAVIPALTDVSKRFLAWYAINQDVIKQKIDEYAGKVGAAFTLVGDVIARVDKMVGGAEGWAKLVGVMASLSGATGAGFVAIKVGALVAAIVQAGVAVAGLVGGGGALVAILASIVAGVAQVVAIFAILAIGALVWQDIYTFIQGGDSVLGRLIVRMQEAGGVLGALGTYLLALKSVWAAVGTVAFPIMNFLWEWVTGIIGFFFDLGAGIASFVGSAINSFGPLIEVLNFVSGLLNKIAGAAGIAPSVAGAPTMAVPAMSAGMASQAAAGAQTVAGAGAGGTTSTAQTVSIGGDVITIQGAGLTETEVRAVLEAASAEKARRVASALAGAEV